jgi:uncharacterized protein (TIGR03792 family)
MLLPGLKPWDATFTIGFTYIFLMEKELKTVVVELLKVEVVPEERDNYIQKDAEIWTTSLAKYPGFLGKEVWINPNHPTELILIIRWGTREQWKAIPSQDLQIIEDKFTQIMGKSYPIVKSAEFEVFPHT